MFCSTRMIVDCRWGYVSREESCDYGNSAEVPWSVKANPLRYEIGIGRRRPCFIRINKRHRAWLPVANAIYRIKCAISPRKGGDNG